MSDLIRLKNGQTVPSLDLKPENIIDKSFLLYGKTGSGKTAIIDHILYALSKHIDQIIVICPSEETNGSYSGKVPQACIHSRLYLADPSKKKDTEIECAKRYLRDLMSRQEALNSSCMRANKMATITKLFDRIDQRLRSGARDDLLKVDRIKVAHEKLIKNNKKLSAASISDNYEKLERSCNTAKCKIMKYYIDKDITYLKDLMENGELSKDEIICIEYKDVNPHMLLLFDDYAANIKNLSKTEEFTQLFYRGRHYGITLIFACQDDTDLNANIRKQAFYSIFTMANVAEANFTRESNRYSHETKELTKLAIPEIFREMHRKIVHTANDDKIYHFKAQYPIPSFKFGSPALWKLCEALEEQDESLKQTNKYYKIFA